MFIFVRNSAFWNAIKCLNQAVCPPHVPPKKHTKSETNKSKTTTTSQINRKQIKKRLKGEPVEKGPKKTKNSSTASGRNTSGGPAAAGMCQGVRVLPVCTGALTGDMTPFSVVSIHLSQCPQVGSIRVEGRQLVLPLGAPTLCSFKFYTEQL